MIYWVSLSYIVGMHILQMLIIVEDIYMYMVCIKTLQVSKKFKSSMYLLPLFTLCKFICNNFFQTVS